MSVPQRLQSATSGTSSTSSLEIAIAAASRLVHAQNGASIPVGDAAVAASRLIQSSSSSLHCEEQYPEALSDEAMRVIQALSQRLSKMRQQTAETTKHQQKAAATMEERKQRFNMLMDRRNQSAAELESIRAEQRKALQQEKAIMDELSSSERELEKIRLGQQERCVPLADYDALQQEFQKLSSQLAEARTDSEELQSQIAKQRRMSVAKQHREEAVKDLSESQAAEERDELEARQLAQLKRAEQSAEKQKSIRVRCQSEFADQREQSELENKEANEHALALEERMEMLRQRNRQLESTLRRSQEIEEQELGEMREEVRRRAQQIKILSDLLREGLLSDPAPRPAVTTATAAENKRYAKSRLPSKAKPAPTYRAMHDKKRGCAASSATSSRSVESVRPQFELTLHDESDTQKDEDALLIYKPGEVAVCPSTCVSEPPSMVKSTLSAQQERIQQLQQLTEGWDTDVSDTTWGSGLANHGTRSGGTLSTVSGPLTTLEEESTGSSEDCEVVKDDSR